MSERRTVLKVLAGCATAGATAVAALPSAALLTQPGNDGEATEAAWIRVSRLDVLRVGVPVRAPVVGAEEDAWTRATDRRLGMVWLIRDNERDVRAFSAVCPHLGCTIELSSDHFVCPCHDSDFTLQGAVRTGPSPRAMDPLPVRITEGNVSVQFRKFRLGTTTREPA